MAVQVYMPADMQGGWETSVGKEPVLQFVKSAIKECLAKTVKALRLLRGFRLLRKVGQKKDVKGTLFEFYWVRFYLITIS